VKQVYGSNFSFDNFGQIDDVGADPRANSLVVSGAYGGFTNTWGAQVMPFSTGTFRTWPISRQQLEPHYREVLKRIPYSGETDDLEEIFPLLGTPDHLPKVAPRTSAVLQRYARHRIAVRAHGVTAGHARLAMSGASCRLCGLCMTGCPYQLIYSASQTFDRLRAQRRVDYRPGLRVHRVEEDVNGRVTVHATETATGQLRSFGADRVFLGAGAIGTTRIVASSLGLENRSVTLAEAVQFMMPFLSRKAVPELTQAGEFTLNQFKQEHMLFHLSQQDHLLLHLFQKEVLLLKQVNC
jgi:choline dehydrogenase-like flavoprotein